MDMIIRGVTPADYDKILNIYAPYITDTAISYETRVPSPDEFAARINSIANEYPYLVCESGGEAAGYAYASKHGERAAYLFGADVSVYVARGHHRKGIGRALYTKLFELLTEQGFYAAYAGIDVPNENSQALHKSFGFREIGVYKNVGYKFGKWLDVMWLEKQLRPRGDCLFEYKINSREDWAEAARSLEVFAPLVRYMLCLENLPQAKIENLSSEDEAVFKAGDYAVRIFAPAWIVAEDNNASNAITSGTVHDKYDFQYIVTKRGG